MSSALRVGLKHTDSSPVIRSRGNMTTFAKTGFSHAAYASFRPSYPASLYQTVLAYHRGGRDVCVDLGCGHGLISRTLAGRFAQVHAIDPSRGMIEQAKAMTPDITNIEFTQASAESLPFLQDRSVDLVVAGQAAHWFNCAQLFPELKRIMRPGGTLAFWAYKDHVYIDHPQATRILDLYSYGDNKYLLGPYWPQPGRSIVRDKLRVIQPPAEDWTDIDRIEYEPSVTGEGSGDRRISMSMTVTLGQTMEYIRTSSAFHGWMEAHPGQQRRSAGGRGDIVDEIFDQMMAAEEDWKGGPEASREKLVRIEWGTVLLLGRKL